MRFSWLLQLKNKATADRDQSRRHCGLSFCGSRREKKQKHRHMRVTAPNKTKLGAFSHRRFFARRSLRLLNQLAAKPPK
jgi:hypothetical protein